MKELLIKLSDLMYSSFLTAPGHPEYQSVYANVGKIHGGCFGMMWALVFLLVVSILFAAYFYFVLSRSIDNATKKNYLIVGLLGMIVLVLVTTVGLKLVSGYVDSSFWSSNLLAINVANLVYFVIFYEIWSLVFLPFSNATVHLFKFK